MSEFRLPTCHYHPTYTEKLAVKLLGNPILSQIDAISQMRDRERDPNVQRKLWSEARFKYHQAVNEMRKRPECPPILQYKPDMK